MNKYFIFGLVTVLLSACKEPETPPKTIRPAQVWTTQQAAQQAAVTYAGEIKARYEADLAFRVGGKVVQRTVDVGDSVNPEQDLAQLDAADLNLNIANAQQAVNAVQAEAENAQAELNRVLVLRQKQFIGQAAVDTAQAAVNAMSARVKAAQAQLKLTGNQAEYTHLLADKAGVITTLYAEEGQVVAAGQPIVRVAYAGEREVHIRVGESTAQTLKQGTPVAIQLWSKTTQVLQGKVREIAPATDVTRSFLVKISIVNPPDALRLGMTAEVSVATPVTETTVFLPNSALYQQGKQAAVWVVDAQHTVRLTPIEVMSYSEEGIYVKGLAEGTSIIAAGVHKLTAGQQIHPVPYDGKAGS